MKKLILGVLVCTMALAVTGCAQFLGSKVNVEQVMVPAPVPEPGKGRLTDPIVTPGIEVLLDTKWKTVVEENGKKKKVPIFDQLVKGKRVGLITNPTGVDSNLVSTIDLLHENPEVELVKLFAPEHGIRGDIYAGDKVETDVDPKTGVEVVSIYGRQNRPTPEMVQDLDIVLYDIQDVGSSSYTFVYSMAYMMEACAEAGVKFAVLDRPAPTGADYIDGPVLNTENYRTGVGYYDIAYMYGMTPGELGALFNKEFLEKEVEYVFVPMVNYVRKMRYFDTGLPWIPPSNHIPGAEHAFYYSLTGVIGELRSKISIGVGYTLPFETIAAPWIDRDELVDAINRAEIEGLMARPITYQPRYAAYTGETVHGAHLIITDYYAIRPVTAQIKLMEILQDLYPEQNIFTSEEAKRSLFDEVLGTDDIREYIAQGQSTEFIMENVIEPRQEMFKDIRNKYKFYKNSFFEKKQMPKSAPKNNPRQGAGELSQKAPMD